MCCFSLSLDFASSKSKIVRPSFEDPKENNNNNWNNKRQANNNEIVKNSSHVELLRVKYDNGSIVFDYECHAQRGQETHKNRELIEQRAQYMYSYTFAGTAKLEAIAEENERVEQRASKITTTIDLWSRWIEILFTHFKRTAGKTHTEFNQRNSKALKMHSAMPIYEIESNRTNEAMQCVCVCVCASCWTPPVNQTKL